jgi:uncharacterized protein involved in exopolysaccharide biosynthesis
VSFVERDPPNAATGRLEVLPLLHFVLDHWRWVAGGALLAGIVAFALSFAMPKVYEAEVIAVPVKDQQGLSSLRSLMSGAGALASLAGLSLPGSDNPAEMAVVRLKSRGFLEGFIAEQQLLPQLFSSRWDAGAKQWRDDGEPPPSAQDGYVRLSRKALRATIDKRTGTVSVKIRWRDPETAASWANALVQRLNRVTRKLAIEEAERSVDYLTTELTEAQSVELRQSIAMLLEGQMNRRMFAATQPDFTLKVIDSASPSDIDRFVSPRRLVMLIGGIGVGALLGVLLAFLRFAPVTAGRVVSSSD